MAAPRSARTFARISVRTFASRHAALLVAVVCVLSACAGPPITAEADQAPEGAPTRTVEVTARKYEFDPAEVRVRQGERVTLILESEDVTHGFGLGELDIDVDLPKGQPVEVTFYAAVKGSTSFRCTHLCGWGHFGMNGEIIIE